MDEEELFNLVAYVRRSLHRRQILATLAEGAPHTPIAIARNLDIHRNHVSNQLGKHLNHRLVTVLNPDDYSHRYYNVTEKGTRVLDYLGRVWRVRGIKAIFYISGELHSREAHMRGMESKCELIQDLRYQTYRMIIPPAVQPRR